jgi:hypothetical protein
VCSVVMRFFVSLRVRWPGSRAVCGNPRHLFFWWGEGHALHVRMFENQSEWERANIPKKAARRDRSQKKLPRRADRISVVRWPVVHGFRSFLSGFVVVATLW